MTDVVTPTLQGFYGVLVPFILGTLGLTDAQIIQGIQNRAAMPLDAPTTSGFIVVQTITRHQLRTNLHTYSTDPTQVTQGIEQGVELGVQIDCYGPNSEDWATILSTVLRDNVGCVALAPTAAPLYAEDARMIPLVDGEDQYEERWSLDAHFQYNPVTTAAQQYAEALAITLINVEALSA